MVKKSSEEAKKRLALRHLVVRIAAAMETKLQKKRRQGFVGWDDVRNRGDFIEEIWRHLRKFDRTGDVAQLVDVANLAAFVWAFGPTCRECGCTEANACIGGCAWADEKKTICTGCAP